MLREKNIFLIYLGGGHNLLVLIRKFSSIFIVAPSEFILKPVKLEVRLKLYVFPTDVKAELG